MDQVSFFEWLEQPRQIVLFSSFFMILCFAITKISKLRKHRHHDFRVRDPRKGHHWVHSDFIIKPTFCNICETTIVRGVFCDTCWVCVHDECEEDGNKRLACKVMSLSTERRTMKHHWVKGNLALCSACAVCTNPCGVEPKLCDYRCVWCQTTVHEGQCFGQFLDHCTFGENSKMVLPPFSITLKTVGWKGRRRHVIKEVKAPPFKDWEPTLVIANPKSGSNQGVKLLRAFRLLLNPAQVIDLSEIPPETALEFCRLLPTTQCRVLVCGGDGTVGWVLDALDKVELPKRPLIGIHPMGTGNDLARVLGWGVKYVGDEHEIDELLQDFENATRTPFDRWTVNIKNTGLFGKNLPAKNLSMNSYVSLGCDAQVVLNFHKHREHQPSLFTSRIINKLMYFIYGSKDVLEAQCKNLHERVELELDGKKIKLPHLEGIVILNINSWCGGCQIWNNNQFEVDKESSFNDGYLEIAGLYSALHIAKLQVKLAEPIKLGRAKVVKITVHKTKEAKKVPMQLDGEPWEQGSCVITVTHKGQVLMLKKKDDS
ncbi:diacylglycerol kinase epsilon-like [Clytia hemisphaerica]|uniref:Diacylglycerol kinase n=1 Tax=Clytia hemisphaerica TaxID=252671 RepID=A0A7M5VBU1_9CNID